MQAQSLLESTRTIDARLDDLLSVNLLAGSSVAWTHAAVIRATLGDVAEQLRASAPFPSSSDSTREDEAFLDLLGALAESEDPTPECVAELLDGGQQTIDRLRDADRVEIRASTLVVPLDGDPSGCNWWSLLKYLHESVGQLAAKAGRLRSRIVVDGTDNLLVTAWDSVAERLNVLGGVLDETIANGRYAGRSATVDDEPTEFVAWTADQFGGDG